MKPGDLVFVRLECCLFDDSGYIIECLSVGCPAVIVAVPNLLERYLSRRWTLQGGKMSYVYCRHGVGWVDSGYLMSAAGGIRMKPGELAFVRSSCCLYVNVIPVFQYEDLTVGTSVLVVSKRGSPKQLKLLFESESRCSWVKVLSSRGVGWVHESFLEGA